jgi:hypothetical protein
VRWVHFGLLSLITGLLSGCMAIGMWQDATDQPQKVTVHQNFEIATTRFSRAGNFVSFVFGATDIWVAAVQAGSYTIRDRYLLPGDGLEAAAKALSLTKLSQETACPEPRKKKALSTFTVIGQR